MKDEDPRPRPEEVLADRGWLVRIARGLLGDESAADDVVQDTLVASLGRGAPPDVPRPWLRRVVRNLVGERARRRGRRESRERLAAREGPPSNRSPEEVLERMELQQLVAEEVMRLDEPYRTTVLLRYTEDLAPAEIARRLDLPGGTVRRRLKHGLDLLRERLDRRTGGDRRAWAGGLIVVLEGIEGEGARAGGLLALAVPLVVLGTAAVLVVLSATADRRREDTPARPASTAELPAPPGDEPLASAAAPAAPPARTEVPPADAPPRWVEGVVERAAACDPQEELAVVVLDRPTSWATLLRTRALDGLERFPVDADGRFRVPAAGAERAHLLLVGERSYLRRSVAVRPGGVVRLRPEAGTSLRGEVRAASGEPAAGVPVLLCVARGEVTVEMLQSGDLHASWTTTDGRGAFRFPPAPPGYGHEVFALPLPGSGGAAVRASVPSGESCDGAALELALEPDDQLLRGRVIAPDGRALGGARVRCALPGGWPTAAPVLGETVTDVQGRFAFPGLPSGVVVLDVGLEGYQPRREVPASAGSGEQVLELRPGAFAVRGTALDPSGSPAAGVAVVLGPQVPSRPSPFDAATPWVETHTDARGRFAFDDVGEGPHRLHASRQGASEPALVAERLGVVAGEEDLVLRLTGSAVLAGRVESAATGAPVRSFELVLGRTVPGEEGVVETRRLRFDDAEGRFRAELLPGRWTARARAEGYLSPGARLFELRDEIELVLVVAPEATVAGTVVSSGGEPVEGAVVLLTTEATTLQVADQTGADGAYFLREVPPGDYTLRVFDELGRRRGEPLPVSLDSGEALDGVELVLPTGGALHGRTLARGDAPAAGVPVQVRHAETGITRVATTGDDGRFAFDGLEEGLWAASVAWAEVDDLERHAAGAFLVADAAAARTDTRGIEVEPDAVAEAVFRRRGERAVPVRGEVWSGGAPHARAGVAFVRGAPDGPGRPAEIRSVTTDERGRFEVELEPGVYSIHADATPHDRSDAINHVFVRHLPPAGDAALRLEAPSGLVEGRLVHPDGRPAGGARVSLALAGRGEHPHEAREARTDADGRFAFAGLWAGEYALAVGGPCPGCPADVEGLERRLVGPLRLEPGEVLAGLDRTVAEAGAALDVYVRRPSGEPVRGASIFVRDADGRVLDPSCYTPTNAEGRALYRWLPPGTYTASARAAGEASAESGPVVVAPAASPRVDLVLEQATQLAVELRDARGAPAPGTFEVRDARGRRVDGLLGAVEASFVSLRGHRSPTGAVVGPLVPGRYELVAFDAAGLRTITSVDLDGEPARRVVVPLGPETVNDNP